MFFELFYNLIKEMILGDFGMNFEIGETFARLGAIIGCLCVIIFLYMLVFKIIKYITEFWKV